jgi:peptidoglycan/LPS O-acetylase OafA/YrhL
MSRLELFQSSEETLNPVKSTKIRLDYLDGMRGLAALYVVWFHIYLDAINTKSGIVQLPYLLHSIIEVFMSHGASSVAIFIVLSGYCLMLPVARSSDGKLRGGVIDYIKRRARRILPPYYAALFFSEGTKTHFQRILQILEGRWLVKLGAFSYSLYLIHTITMALLQLALKDAIRTPLLNFCCFHY